MTVTVPVHEQVARSASLASTTGSEVGTRACHGSPPSCWAAHCAELYNPRARRSRTACRSSAAFCASTQVPVTSCESYCTAGAQEGRSSLPVRLARRSSPPCFARCLAISVPSSANHRVSAYLHRKSQLSCIPSAGSGPANQLTSPQLPASSASSI